jgi:hypothetical protein
MILGGWMIYLIGLVKAKMVASAGNRCNGEGSGVPLDPQMDFIELRVRVRDLLARGALPKAASKKTLCAGPSRGNTCVVCGMLIGGGQTEYEASSPRYGAHLKFHLVCHAAWHIESAR